MPSGRLDLATASQRNPDANRQRSNQLRECCHRRSFRCHRHRRRPRSESPRPPRHRLRQQLCRPPRQTAYRRSASQSAFGNRSRCIHPPGRSCEPATPPTRSAHPAGTNSAARSTPHRVPATPSRSTPLGVGNRVPPPRAAPARSTGPPPCRIRTRRPARRPPGTRPCCRLPADLLHLLLELPAHAACSSNFRITSCRRCDACTAFLPRVFGRWRLVMLSGQAIWSAPEENIRAVRNRSTRPRPTREAIKRGSKAVQRKRPQFRSVEPHPNSTSSSQLSAMDASGSWRSTAN